jgi:phage gp36-like protein
MYCTPLDVANTATSGWAELAQRAMPEGAGVDGQLLQAALVAAAGLAAGTGAGVSWEDWADDAQALGLQAAARVNDAIAMAGKHIDTYLFPRYRGVMPLSPETVQASSLPAVCAAIALRRLYGASLPEELRLGTKWADQYLADLNKGLVSIGQPDTAVAQPAGSVVSKSKAKAFAWEGY